MQITYTIVWSFFKLGGKDSAVAKLKVAAEFTKHNKSEPL
jgi:hypothetical protein